MSSEAERVWQKAEKALKRARKIKDKAERTGTWNPRTERQFDYHARRAERLMDKAEELDEREEPIVGKRSSRGFDGFGGTVASDGADFEGRTSDGLEVRTFSSNSEVSAYEWHRKRSSWDPVWDEVGIGRYFRAIITGARDEAEERALSLGTDSAGGHMVPAPLSARFIDLLRVDPVLGRLGIRTVEMDSKSLDIARLASDVSAAWTPENSTGSSTDMTFEAVQLDAKKYLGIMRASRELIADAPNAEEAIERSFRGTFSEALQRAVLVGSTGANEPTGVSNSTEVSVVSFGGTTAGAAPSSTGAAGWDDLLTARQALQDDNVSPGQLDIFWAPRTERQFGALRDGQSGWLNGPPLLNGVRRVATPTLPSTLAPSTSLTGASKILMGDFSNVLLGVRLDPTMQILNERYAENWQTGFLMAARWDVQFERPEALRRIEWVTT